MGVLRPLALALLAACYAPEIPDCARTDSCARAVEIDAGDTPADASPDATPPDAAPLTVLLVVRIDGRGDVTVPGASTCSAGNGNMTCQYVVPKGVALALGAMPKNDWRFDRWEDACTGTGGATCTITPSSTTSVRARFEQDDD